MKVKTSITLSQELLSTIDRLVETSGSRSAFIEKAVRAYLAQTAREEQDRRELQAINRNAARLNEEALDTLAFQAEL